MSKNIIELRAKTASIKSGVYKMIDRNAKVIYVGKAKNIKKRLLQYTKPQTNRIESMISKIHTIECTETSNETEALILESNLIKKLKPKFNILLKDDKSFPFIFLDMSHAFPRLYKYRGTRKENCYGPFTSAGNALKTIALLKKAFLIRSCSDNDFASRSKPCMEYQIRRCSAPCVNFISKLEYRESVTQLIRVLKGDMKNTQHKIIDEMNKASANQQYEHAIIHRDRLRALQEIVSYSTNLVEEGDIAVIKSMGNKICIYIKIFKDFYNNGNRVLFFDRNDEADSEIMSKFLLQFYENAPKIIYLNLEIDIQTISALEAISGHKIKAIVPKKGTKLAIIQKLEEEADRELRAKLDKSTLYQKNLEMIAKFFCLEKTPERVEVYDNSHISGSFSIGVSIAIGNNGFIKSAYRKYNIQESAGNDDYGMMKEVISKKLKSKNIPDFILIDGGLGHMNALKEILHQIPFACISKGPQRKTGTDKVHLLNGKTINLDAYTPFFKFLQIIRNEAHRFAISTHRKKRDSSFIKSALDDIPGIGPRRRNALLACFGSIDAIKNSSIKQIACIDGISSKIAQTILDRLNEK